MSEVKARWALQKLSKYVGGAGEPIPTYLHLTTIGVSELEAEIVRLRAALQEIVRHAYEEPMSEEHIVAVAHDALQPASEESISDT